MTCSTGLVEVARADALLLLSEWPLLITCQRALNGVDGRIAAIWPVLFWTDLRSLSE